MKKLWKKSDSLFSYVLGGSKPPKKGIASSAVPHWGSSAMTGFHERAKMRENISHGCKAMRGKAPGRVACLEFAEGEKRTAITTDRAVEEILPRHYCVVME